MQTYKVTLSFDNLDNFMGTDHQASVDIDIKSDDLSHAYLLAQRLQRVYEADNFSVDVK